MKNKNVNRMSKISFISQPTGSNPSSTLPLNPSIPFAHRRPNKFFISFLLSLIKNIDPSYTLQMGPYRP